MELKRRTVLIYTLLAALWVVVIVWQAQEHQRVKSYARAALRNRSKDIASSLGAFIRGSQFSGAVFGHRLQPVLDELVGESTNNLVVSGEVLSIALLNAAGETLASAGAPANLEQVQSLSEGERWGQRSYTVVYPIAGISVSPERGTNAAVPVVILTNAPRPFRRDGLGPDRSGATNSFRGDREARPMPPPPDERRQGRPFWARGVNEHEYQAMIQKRELHGLVLGMSIETFQTIVDRDVRMRWIICFFGTLAAAGSALAWRVFSRSSDLQIRLVRASELNSHLKQMNLAAAGLAHETRNPLNIIRGLAQMISKRQDLPGEIQTRSREIVEEADKVAGQLNEFINYSRPREVRRTAVSLGSVVGEVVRALNYDIEEKKIQVQLTTGSFSVEADEQLLRQALFNLILNATQAVDGNGQIVVSAEKTPAGEVKLEIADNGPGVLPEHRSEIFKPYFTTQEKGTGLGLAVVQQIVMAHGWEVECVPNQPKGAIFRITHLKPAS